MASVVFDASAIIALLIGEAGADQVAPYIGDGVISAVNLQEVIKALLRRGIPLSIAREMIGELHLDIRPHGQEEAFAAAALHLVTREWGSGIGDRTCMALAISEQLPALTADRAWARINAAGLEVLLVR